MKKLSVFIYSMAGGGAERVVSNLLKYLVNHFEIHLILQNNQIDYELPKGVKIHLLENSKPFESKNPFSCPKIQNTLPKLRH